MINGSHVQRLLVHVHMYIMYFLSVVLVLGKDVIRLCSYRVKSEGSYRFCHGNIFMTSQKNAIKEENSQVLLSTFGKLSGENLDYFFFKHFPSHQFFQNHLC